MSVESSLKATVGGGNVLPGLTITYDDMHGLWGGATIVIRGSGHGEMCERAHGQESPRVFESAVSAEQLSALVELLVRLEAWEQRTPPAMPLPDESRATLTISVGGQTSTVWERYNDMADNACLSVVRAKMRDFMTSGLVG